MKSSNPTGSVTLNGAELDAVVDCHDDGPPAWCRSGETTLVKTPEIAMQVTLTNKNRWGHMKRLVGRVFVGW